MTDFHQIYAAQADAYEAMVAAEDYQGNLWKALEGVRPLTGLDVVELGAGTGRLTLYLAPRVRSISAFDQSAHMLSVTEAKLRAAGLTNARTGVADNAALPVPSACADLAIAGWSLGHSCGWFAETWREVIGQAVAEMVRVLRPGGTAIIFETLGTGTERPGAPTDGLAAYYQLLETTYGFTRTVIQTDYQFASPEDAAAKTRFFFGDALADRLLAERRSLLPEWTGMWHKHR